MPLNKIITDGRSHFMFVSLAFTLALPQSGHLALKTENGCGVGKLSRIYCFKIGCKNQVYHPTQNTKDSRVNMFIEMAIFVGLQQRKKYSCRVHCTKHENIKNGLPFLSFEFRRHKNDDIFFVSFVFTFSREKKSVLHKSFVLEKKKVRHRVSEPAAFRH